MPTFSLRLGLFLALFLPLGIFGLGSARAQFGQRPPQPGVPPQQPNFPQQPQLPQPPNPNIPNFNPNPGPLMNVWKCNRCGYQVQLPLGQPAPTCPTCSRVGGSPTPNPGIAQPPVFNPPAPTPAPNFPATPQFPAPSVSKTLWKCDTCSYSVELPTGVTPPSACPQCKDRNNTSTMVGSIAGGVTILALIIGGIVGAARGKGSSSTRSGVKNRPRRRRPRPVDDDDD
jgi:DNA-directed RNA polymerase subunit RPC12/RpoP